MTQAVATQNGGARLPMPADLIDADDIDARKWRVLCETTFPAAKTPEAILMALDYCRARGLDVFKKPVHIVPMWNSTLRREVETVWPGINEIQITASRTRAWAGMDEPKWGPDIKQTFEGRKRDGGNWVSAKVELTFPEWCAVTVYRMIEGQRCAFTEPVYWLEAYSRTGGQTSALPTDMWVKRPRGQLHKVAKAASLRAAFPEEGEYTAEEMEGKEIEAGGVVIEPTVPQRSSYRLKQEGGDDVFKSLVAKVGEATTVPELRALHKEYAATIASWPNDWQASFETEVYDVRLAELDAGRRAKPKVKELQPDASETVRLVLLDKLHKCPDATAINEWQDANREAFRSMTKADQQEVVRERDARLAELFKPGPDEVADEDGVLEDPPF